MDTARIGEKFIELVEIMARLRGEQGCPWDKKQNHRSLMPYLIEETYEVLESIEDEKPGELAEELGDLMLQIVFHSEIGRQADEFNICDVLDSINQKLIRRHPHIFGNVEVENAEDVVRNWEEIKLREKNRKPRKSLMDGIPQGMPALLYGRRLQERAAGVGFDWPDINGVLEKVEEEIAELREAFENDRKEEITDELGDLLFALVNIGRWKKVNPEEALRKTCKKFERRFKVIEEEAEKRGVSLSDMDLYEMEDIWQKSKKLEK
ncbi:MAG: nucleoside triphosphate pyrophosphohydrolase [Vulcanimicrobiota bacterium]